MKKLFFALSLLLVVGGGCLSLGRLGGPKIVEGDWYLAFDLPSGWVMTVPYQEPNTAKVVPSQSVDRSENEIFLQTTVIAIVNGGIKPGADVPIESYVPLTGQTQIKVSRLDPHRVVPEEAEDIGDGFFKVKLCEDGGDCQIYGRYNYDLYLKTDTANYKFIIYGDDVSTAENIIKSAEVVTIPEVAE